ncbi:hypothetical protein AEGHOMDF_6048 [Methylobacterium soli]|nr:hypothetical protein AEGHOMDF_6048 [Methylobacterium soli]
MRSTGIVRVLIGWRPAGFSSRIETSMSPKKVSASVRGIGVAVITRKSTASPLAPRARRWCTPKRCCSSTTARPRSWNTTLSWNTAWVPTRMSIAPAARSLSVARRSGARSRPVIRRRRKGPAIGPRRSKCWRARISVGAIRTACRPASTAEAIASSATAVLPEPTSPWSRRSMRRSEARSARISATARACAPVSPKGRAASIRPASCPSPALRRPGLRRWRARRSASASCEARISS